MRRKERRVLTPLSMTRYLGSFLRVLRLEKRAAGDRILARMIKRVEAKLQNEGT